MVATESTPGEYQVMEHRGWIGATREGMEVGARGED